MFYKRSTYIYLVVGSRHPAAAAGTPMCGRDPSARSAGDKRQRREGRLQVGFVQIYALFLVRYTPCFWLKSKIYAQKAFLENTAYNTGRIFLGV
jgi:hypothetical protein